MTVIHKNECQAWTIGGKTGGGEELFTLTNDDNSSRFYKNCLLLLT